jgi:outer membrane biosynthesis protein TonB
MNGQLRLNVILPIVLFAALAAAGGLFMLSRSPETSTAATESSLTPLPRPTAAPTKPTPSTPAKPAPKPANTAKPKPARPARPKVKLNPGLPPALSAALRSRPVAVVSLVTPDARIDSLVAAEAAAGARAAEAAFVTVDVSRERQVKPFTLMLGVLETPTVLVFKRPGELFVQLDGYADLDTVAQAVDNARP